jgi:hypothetical protein
MSTPTSSIVAAVAVFSVAALLYYQSYGATESFSNQSKYDNVPADLHRAPPTLGVSQIPTPNQQPVGVPGPNVAPKEAMANRKDIAELEVQITTWLDGAAQRERERPGNLTPDQLQRRVMLVARLNDLRDQLGANLIMDPYRLIAAETMELRRENAGWRQMAPNAADIFEFGKGVGSDVFLSPEQYGQFRGLFDAALQELQAFIQPDPLQRVRLQQLQVMRQDLLAHEARYRPNPPPIRMAAARLYLQQMLKPDQPLPTLYSMEPDYSRMSRFIDSPADVLGQLQDIAWSLNVTYDPTEQELKRSVAAMISRVKAGGISPETARAQIATFQNYRAPGPATTANTLGYYDPKNLTKRAHTLCMQIHEAFPSDAIALGCPPAGKSIQTTTEAETVINTVCDRLRYSVPSVAPEQFNCPVRSI